MGYLTQSNPLTNFEIQKHYQNKPRFNGVYSRNNLPEKIKDGAYVINLDVTLDEYYQNESRFNGVYSRNNLPEKIKDGPYVIKLDEYADVGTQWIALVCNRREILCFDSFGIEQVREELNKSGIKT